MNSKNRNEENLFEFEDSFTLECKISVTSFVMFIIYLYLNINV